MKGHLAEIGRLKISATAKYVAQTMLVSGTSNIREIHELTGLPERTIYRAKREYMSATSGRPLSSVTLPSVAERLPPVAESAISGSATSGKITATSGKTAMSGSAVDGDPSDLVQAPLACADITTHGNTESLQDSYYNFAESLSLPPTPTPSGRVVPPGDTADSDLDSKIPPIEKTPTSQAANSESQAAKNKIPLIDRFAAAVDDPDLDGDGRYGAAFEVLTAAGIARAQIAKLGRFIGDFDEAVSVLRSVAKARDPATYLAKIVRTREQEAKQESLAMAGLLDEPEFVRGYRREGYSPIYKRPDGNWEISRWTFTPEGEEIGG
jgi:hypothetical protein